MLDPYDSRACVRARLAGGRLVFAPIDMFSVKPTDRRTGLVLLTADPNTILASV